MATSSPIPEGYPFPTATSRPVDTARPTATETEVPTSTPWPSDTPGPSPTYEPIPTSTPIPPAVFAARGPLAVAMTKEEARQRTLGLLDPARRPKIEFIRLVTADQLRRVVPEISAFCDEYPYTDCSGYTDAYVFPNSDLPIYVVWASTAGMDSRVPELATRELSPCWPVAANQREDLFVFIDATSGAIVGSKSSYQMWWELPALLARIESASVDQQASARLRESPPATVSPTPGGHPWPAPTLAPLLSDTTLRLTDDQVPPDMKEALKTLPVRAGNWWEYSKTDRTGGVAWSRRLMTATIYAEFGLGTRGTVFAVRYGSLAFPDRDEAPSYEFELELFPLPSGLLYHEGQFQALRRQDVLNLHDLQHEGIPITATAASSSQAPRTSGESVRVPWSTLFGICCGEVRDIKAVPVMKTQAGTFKQCQRGHHMDTGGVDQFVWVCDGVGVVRIELHQCVHGGYSMLTELTRYHVAH